MNENSFKIDFKKLAIEWLPTFLRTAFLVAFSMVLIMPLVGMYIEFLKVRKQHLIRMQHNFQKFSMQKRLNDAFDPIERRIEILKTLTYIGTYLYTKAEDDILHSKTKWLYGDDQSIYLRTKSELYSDIDFIVKIPNANINQDQLIAEIEYYMLQSKNYQIKIV